MKTKHSIAIFITFIMMLSLWNVCSVSASAAKAKAPSCAKKLVIQTLKSSEEDAIDSEYNGGYLCIANLAAGAKIYSVKSSNSSIAADSMLKTHGFQAIHVYPKNARVKNNTKSTITFKVKQNKKVYSLKSTVTLKYVSPFKTLKLGNKQFVEAKHVEKAGITDFKGIRVDPAAGYKITSIVVIGKVSYMEDEDGNLCPSSYAYRFAAKDISRVKERYFSNVKKVIIYYRATKKPADYKAPKNWSGELESPLYGMKTITFE